MSAPTPENMDIIINDENEEIIGNTEEQTSYEPKEIIEDIAKNNNSESENEKNNTVINTDQKVLPDSIMCSLNKSPFKRFKLEENENLDYEEDRANFDRLLNEEHTAIRSKSEANEKIDDMAPTEKGFYHCNGKYESLESPAEDSKIYRLFKRLVYTLTSIHDYEVDGRRSLRYMCDIVNPFMKKLAQNDSMCGKQILIANTFENIFCELSTVRSLTGAPYILNQLSPYSCHNLKREVISGISLKNLYFKMINGSSYIEVDFDFCHPIKIIFVATMASKSVSNSKTQGVLDIYNGFGNSLNNALQKVYKRMFDLTQKKVHDLMNSFEFDEPTRVDNTNSMMMAKSTSKRFDRSAAVFLKQELNETFDLQKNTSIPFQATSGGGVSGIQSNKLRVLSCTKDKKLAELDMWGTDFDAVFISSMLRTRIVADGTFWMQVYSNTAIHILE